jgi:WD40 repeat protein
MFFSQMKRTNVQSLLDRRELYFEVKTAKQLAGHHSVVEGLRVVSVLDDHTGCVNTVDWHADGEVLLTAGDDLKAQKKKKFGFPLFLTCCCRSMFGSRTPCLSGR